MWESRLIVGRKHIASRNLLRVSRSRVSWVEIVACCMSKSNWNLFYMCFIVSKPSVVNYAFAESVVYSRRKILSWKGSFYLIIFALIASTAT